MAEHEWIDLRRTIGAAFEIGMKVAPAHTDGLHPHDHLIRRRRRRGGISVTWMFPNVVENCCAHGRRPTRKLCRLQRPMTLLHMYC